MNLILIALALSLTSFNAWPNDEIGLKYQLLAYGDSDNSLNYSNSDEPMSRHEIEDLEYEEDLEYARSKLLDKPENNGFVTHEMVIDYYNNNFSDY